MSDDVSVTSKQPATTLDDVADAVRQQLLILIEWAKYLPNFYQFGLDDQVCRLRIVFDRWLIILHNNLQVDKAIDNSIIELTFISDIRVHSETVTVELKQIKQERQ